jgi:hypothetical protein
VLWGWGWGGENQIRCTGNLYIQRNSILNEKFRKYFGFGRITTKRAYHRLHSVHFGAQGSWHETDYSSASSLVVGNECLCVVTHGLGLLWDSPISQMYMPNTRQFLSANVLLWLHKHFSWANTSFTIYVYKFTKLSLDAIWSYRYVKNMCIMFTKPDLLFMKFLVHLRSIFTSYLERPIVPWKVCKLCVHQGEVWNL